MRNSQLFLLAVAATLLLGCEQKQAELRLITPKSPIDQAIAKDFATLLGRESAVEIRLVPPPEDDATVLDALASGDGDIAIITNNMPFRPDIATVMPLYPSVLHIAYRKGRSTEDARNLLTGARVFAGLPGSASRLMFEKVYRRHGLTESDFSFVDTPDESPDVVVVFAPIVPERMPDLPDYELFSVGNPDDIGKGSIIDTATLLNPQLRAFIIPVGAYGDLTPKPIVTVAVDQLLVARRDLDKTIVYDLVNDLVSLRPALAALQPGLFQEISGEFDASSSAFIIHSGAQAYSQRNAPNVYERYAGIAEVSVTVLVGLFSAFFAGIRIYRMRRKNRIDAFYSDVIAIRNTINESSTADDRQKKTDELRALQAAAFDLLVDEKLAADESFRIFITLSNDVLQQLGALSSDGQFSDA